MDLVDLSDIYIIENPTFPYQNQDQQVHGLGLALINCFVLTIFHIY